MNIIRKILSEDLEMLPEGDVLSASVKWDDGIVETKRLVKPQYTVQRTRSTLKNAQHVALPVGIMISEIPAQVQHRTWRDVVVLTARS
jgi:hypothetical protein